MTEEIAVRTVLTGYLNMSKRDKLDDEVNANESIEAPLYKNIKLNNATSLSKKSPASKRHVEDEVSSSGDEENGADDGKNSLMKEDFTKYALEYRKKFYDFHRAIEKYASTVNNFAAELKKQLTIKVQKILDHPSLADNFERQLYKLARNPKQTRKNWSEEETIFLISLVAYYSYYKNSDYSCFDEAAWKFIAEIYPGKKSDQLRLRWHNVFKVTLSKAPWSSLEDDMLIQIIQEKGPQHWKEIAVELNARSGIGVFRQGKQCRERWINHLDPSIKKGGWSEEEDLKILTNFIEVGKKWAEIAKRLGGRTENGVKNRWISLIKRYKSEVNLDGYSAQDGLEDENWEHKLAQAIIVHKTHKKEGRRGSVDILFRVESENIENGKSESDRRDPLDMKNEESVNLSENMAQSSKKIAMKKVLVSKPALPTQEEKATPTDKKSERKVSTKQDSQKGAKIKPTKNDDLSKNLEEAEYAQSKRSLLMDPKRVIQQQLQLPLPQAQPIAPQIINRRPVPLITQNPYSFYPERFNLPQIPGEEIHYKDDQYPDPRYALNYDMRHFPPNMGLNRNFLVSGMVDPKARVPEQFQQAEYMRGIEGILQQQINPPAAYEQEDEDGWVPADNVGSTATAGEFANKSGSENPYEAHSEDEPHRYLLTEKSLGNGKMLERVIEQYPNTIYFAVVNTQSKEIFFIDAATKRNYNKTLRVIKEEHEEEPNETVMAQKMKSNRF